MPVMKPECKSDLLHLLRSAAVLAVAARAAGVTFYGLLLEIRQEKNVLEGGIVEMSQIAVLGLASLAYAIQAFRDREAGRALAMVSLAVLAMGIRELDGFFDRITGDHSFWLYIDAAVLLAFLAVPLLRPGRTLGQLARFVGSSQCLLLVVGVIFAAVVAQLIGYKEIWNRIFDVEIWQEARSANLLESGHLTFEANIPRHVKNVAEESIELGSYLMILGSAVLPPLLRRRTAAAAEAR